MAERFLKLRLKAEKAICGTYRVLSRRVDHEEVEVASVRVKLAACGGAEQFEHIHAVPPA